MSICAVCTKTITKNSPGITCSGVCGSSYHANSTCSDVAKNQLPTLISLPGARWACQSCRTSQRNRNRSNADTDAEGDLFAVEDITSTAKVQECVQLIHKKIESLCDSINFCSNKITDFEQKLLKFDNLFKNMETLKTENAVLKQKITQMENKMNNLEQLSRSYNIELQDIPEKSNENLVTIAGNVAKMLNFKLECFMLDTIYRVPTQAENKPKNIIIKFRSKLDRDRLLSAAKAARKQLGNKPGFKLDGVSDRFFINEHLPPQTKLLLKQAREKSKNKGFKFVWVQNGNVLIRKTEHSKIVSISCLEDLNAI